MTRFEKNHRFSEVELTDYQVNSLSELSREDLKPGRYNIGSLAKRYILKVELYGERPAAAGGGLYLSNWQNRRTEPVTQTLVYLEDAIHLGQACIVRSDGGVFSESTAHEGKPARGSNLVRRSDGLYAEVDIYAEKTIDQPILYLGNSTGQFGHFLLDLASRFWAVDWAVSNGIKIGVYSPKRQGIFGFQTAFYKAAGLSDEHFVFIGEPVRLRKVYMPVPLYRLHRGVHPEFIRLCSRLGANILSAEFGSPESRRGIGDRIYFSRRLWAKRRVLTNESDVEGLFADLGFKIVNPETLGIGEQIRIARHARHIAAPIGSQTYLALFQRRSESLTILAPSTFTFPDDAIISASKGIVPTFFLGRPLNPSKAGPRDHDYEISLPELKEFLTRSLAAVS